MVCRKTRGIICKGGTRLRIVKVEPGRAPYEKEIENNLKSIQAEVGVGYSSPCIWGQGSFCAANEEGKTQSGCFPNRWLGDDIICGPFSWLVKTAKENSCPSLTGRCS